MGAPDRARTRAPVGGYPLAVIVVVGSPIGRLADGVIRAGGMASRDRPRRRRPPAGPSRWSARPATTRPPMASSSTLAEAASVTWRSSATRHARRRSSRSPTDGRPSNGPTTTPMAAPRDDPTPGATAVVDGPTLEAADVDLGLRYLTEFEVVVLRRSARAGPRRDRGRGRLVGRRQARGRRRGRPIRSRPACPPTPSCSRPRMPTRTVPSRRSSARSPPVSMAGAGPG